MPDRQIKFDICCFGCSHVGYSRPELKKSMSSSNLGNWHSVADTLVNSENLIVPFDIYIIDMQIIG
ncbi:MAG TPA: hypothetical protein DC042_05030 [Bacteroidales bacterium]|nr:hypothetical protein [Bacteroidales bacterium]